VSGGGGKRTHLREHSRGRVHSAPIGRQRDKGALDDKVDQRIKRLFFFIFYFSSSHIAAR